MWLWKWLKKRMQATADEEESCPQTRHVIECVCGAHLSSIGRGDIYRLSGLKCVCGRKLGSITLKVSREGAVTLNVSGGLQAVSKGNRWILS